MTTPKGGPLSLHHSTFEFVSPSAEQIATMNILRHAAQEYAYTLQYHLPDTADRTYLLRKLREVAMWANVAVTRHADGTPRDAGTAPDLGGPDYPPEHPAPGDLGSVPL